MHDKLPFPLHFSVCLAHKLHEWKTFFFIYIQQKFSTDNRSHFVWPWKLQIKERKKEKAKGYKYLNIRYPWAMHENERKARKKEREEN